MAYKRQMSLSERDKVKLWAFTVSDPKLHDKGFTVYKVTCKVFPMNAHERLTEVVIWKRYNDFKQLQKSMETLQRQLHRRDELPNFSKPKLFGRFQDEVIQERIQSSLDLLEFVAKHKHLYRSTAFTNFFKGAINATEDTACQSDILQPSRQDTTHQIPVTTNEDGITKEEVCVVTPDEPTDDSIGVWQFPRLTDRLSLNSFDGDDEPGLTDTDSALSTPLHTADISFFDPLHDDRTGGDENLGDTDNWLNDMRNTCIEIGLDMRDEFSSHLVSSSGDVIESGGSNDGHKDVEMVLSSVGVDGVKECESSSAAANFDSLLSEFDPYSAQKGAVDTGHGDVNLHLLQQPDCETDRELSVDGQLESSSGENIHFSNGEWDHQWIGVGGNYLLDAAQHISRAQELESNGEYGGAFNSYKLGVGILLKGVQGDTNNDQREIVRRKTARYLMKAEDLYNRHMTTETSDERRWAVGSVISSDCEADTSLSFFKSPISDLKQYKVLGTIDGVLLVVDRTSDTTYVIKTIHKSSYPYKRANLIPTSCPYMVQFYKFYENENTIFLVLQYASGGKLWTHINAYVHYNEMGTHLAGGRNDTHNVYRGCKLSCGEESPESGRQRVGDTEHRVSASQRTDPRDASLDVDGILNSSTRSNNGATNSQSSNGHKDVDRQISDASIEHISVSRQASNFTFSDSESESTRCVNDSRFSDDSSFFDPVSPGSYLTQGEKFDDVLISTNPPLETFSICSHDSDSFVHKDAYSYDLAIKSIPESVSSESDRSDSTAVNTSDIHETLSHQSTCDGSNDQSIGRSNKLDRFINLDDEYIPLDDESSRNVTNTSCEYNADLRHDICSYDGYHSDDTTQLHNCDISNEAYNVNQTKSFPGTNQSVSTEQQTENTETVISHSNGENSNVLNQSTSETPAPVQPKTPVRRLNSREVIRSSSFDGDLMSPGRKLHVSGVWSGLDDALAKAGDFIKIPECYVRRWGSEIVVALSRLHSLGIVCRDLKPENIMLDDKGHVLLTYCSQWNHVLPHIDPMSLARLHVAPELRSIGSHTAVCDWWSLGSLLYELLAGKSLVHYHPGGINSHTELILPDHLSTEAQSLLTELLYYNPRERLGSGITGADEIKSHPFFSGVDWSSLNG